MQYQKSTVITRSFPTDSVGYVQIPPGKNRLAIYVAPSANISWFIQFGTTDGTLKGYDSSTQHAGLKFVREECGSAIDDIITLRNATAAPTTFAMIEFVLAP